MTTLVVMVIHEREGVFRSAHAPTFRSQSTNNDIEAKQYISKAIQLFEETGAEGFLKQALQAMESLE